MRAPFSPGKEFAKITMVYQTIGGMTRITLQLDAGTGTGPRCQRLRERAGSRAAAVESTEDYAVTLLE
jgi:hypothetical protein